jgi:hypothetical protein
MADDDLDVRGHWWLPGQEDQKVAGILTFTREKGGELALFGSLRGLLEEGEREERDGVTTISMTMASMERSGVYPRIHGLADNKGYTLEDCFRTSSTNIFTAGSGLETIRVNRIVQGAYFEEGEELEATGISFGLTNLEKWVGESGLTEQWFRVESGRPSPDDPPQFRLEARALARRTVTLGSDRELTLGHGVGIGGDRMTERSLSQGFWWRIDVPVKTSMYALIDLASDLQDLVSAAVGATAALESVKFWHPDIFRAGPDGERYPEAVEFFAQWNAAVDTATRIRVPHQMLFTFDRLGLEGIRGWMAVAEKYRSELGRVMATRYSSGTFVSDRLLNCAAALESFDRERTGKKDTFRDRMIRNAALADSVFEALVGDTEKWASRFKDERNEVAHHFGRASRTAGSDAYALWESAYWLFILCMLKESGAPDAVFQSARASQNFLWQSRRIQAVVL